MANEFKVRKGLIVEGSGSAVLDIQGTQGQLFSVTDDLTGDIFSVSDISGVPILNVNADGTTTIDGTLTLTNDEVLDSTSDTSIKFLTRDSNGVVKYHTLGSNAFNSTSFATGDNFDADGTFASLRAQATTKGDVGLGSVENTAISTFAGSSNITTLGTIGTGTWNGTAIADAYLSSNTAHLSGTQTFTGAKTFSSLSSFTMDGNTITGIDDSGEFTDNDAHIMTSAAVNDRITSFGYTTNTGTLTGNGTSTYIPFYNGTTSFSNSNKLTWDGNYLLTMNLKIAGPSAQNSEATSLMIDSNGIVGTRELGSNAFNSTTIPSLSGNVTIGGDLTVNGNQVTTTGTNADVKFSVWSGTTYGIGMTSGVTYGHLNDYAMTFCMNNDTDRGFWWGYNGQTKSDGAMSLTTAGKLYVKSTIEAQEITAVDTILGRDSQFQRDIVMVTEPADSTSTKALVWEATDAALKIRNIPTNNNQLTNGQGYTTNSGTVTNVQAGNGITVSSGTTTPTITAAPEARTNTTGDLLVNVNGVSRSNYWEINSGLYLQARTDTSGGPRFRSGTGTYSTPSISFKSDTNTGFWGGTDQINISCGGSHRAVFSEAGLKMISSALGVNVNASATNGRIDASNDVVAYSSSDRRWKENIKPIENALSKILKIGGYEFDWKELTEEEKVTQHSNEGHDVGVIAQEVEEVLPEVVTTRENGFKGVKYDKMVALLIEGMKEQQSQIEELKSEIKKLKGEI